MIVSNEIELADTRARLQADFAKASDESEAIVAGTSPTGRWPRVRVGPRLRFAALRRHRHSVAVFSASATSCFGPLSSPLAPTSRSTSSITAMLAASP
jgi:hypothetical protein